MGYNYDLLIKGGMVVDPSQELQDVRDIGICGGRIAAIAAEINPDEADEIIDAAGRVVTPGLIDLHVHVWWGVSHFGIEPDGNCIARGVTTVLDAGSAGADTFPGFRKYVIDASATRIKAFLNLSSQGLLVPEIGELTDLRYANVERALEICETYGEDILGVKIRMSRNIVGNNGPEALKRARRLCEATGLPLMVHPNDSPVSLKDMLGEMKAGDILTHCFHRSDTGILDEEGHVRPEVPRAIEKGVLFDVGHGEGSFSFEVAGAALAQGVEPVTISSDLHRYNLGGPVYDLATTVSKFLALGYTLIRAVKKVTEAPARVMKMQDELGSLKPGATADVAIFLLKNGSFRFLDSQNEVRIGEQKLEPLETIRAGRRYGG